MAGRSQTMTITTLLLVVTIDGAAPAEDRPDIILLMADDQGWGQTGYYQHPVLKTPNLDKMADNGLRFDRFYAGAPNCSPTRATVLTGRSNDRTGVVDHGYPLRLQERTLPQAFREAGYTTAHFGKWHLNGLRGPGAPILPDDVLHAGRFGFDHWLSATNYFDLDPLLSRNGEFEEFYGDSSDVIVRETIHFIRTQQDSDKPFLAVVWCGTRHSPWRAIDADKQQFHTLSEEEQNHYGELTAMDHSIGTLRTSLRRMRLEKNTLVWFCSDNGGLEPFGSDTVGRLTSTTDKELFACQSSLFCSS